MEDYDYDDDDNVTGLTYAAASLSPARRKVEYQYDGENRIIQVSDVTPGMPKVQIAYDFKYHPSGAVTAFTSGNGGRS